MLFNQLTKLEFFENVKKLFPFITLWILLLSATKELVYYFGFGISILNYLELSELTYMFLDDVLIWVLLFVSFIGMGSTKYFDKKFKLKKVNHNPFHLYLYALLNLILYVTVEFLENMVDKTLLYLFASMIVGFLYMAYFTAIFKNSILVKLGMIIPISFLLVFFSSKYKQEAVKDGVYKMETILKFGEDKIVNSDSANIYIGQTNKYVFFYDLKKRQHTVYFKNGISEMSFIKRY